MPASIWGDRRDLNSLRLMSQTSASSSAATVTIELEERPRIERGYAGLQPTASTVWLAFQSGTGGRNRTHYARIWRPPLYQ